MSGRNPANTSNQLDEIQNRPSADFGQIMLALNDSFLEAAKNIHSLPLVCVVPPE